MSHRWASSSLGCFLLLLFVPLCASAAPKDPCKLLQRDLDQQIDDLKAWQKLDLQECSRISGSDSDACRQLQDRHAQDLRMFRDNRTYQMANCRGPQPRIAAAASPFDTTNHDYNSDFYEKYYKNRGPCVEYPYVNCQQYDHYVHLKHHHHHHDYYTASSSGSGKATSAYVEKPGSTDKSTKPGSAYVEKHGDADKSAKHDATATRGAAHDSPAQSARHGSGSDRDNSSNHASSHNDSSSTASSHHSHDSGGASFSGGSHASGGGSESHTSSSSSGSSASAPSHSSGGGGSSGSSTPSASSAPSSSSGGAGAAASSPASSPSHDTGGSRPK